MKNILFLDIKTVPQNENYQSLDDRWKKLWDRKASSFAKNEESPGELYTRAGIYAEFGKIICISAGFVHDVGDNREFRIKSFYGKNEFELLKDFCAMLQNNYNPKSHFLCAHNGKEFDFPYLSRRILINGIQMPDMLDLAGKKPWDVKHLDTMNLWKFGNFKNYTSLDLLSAVFNISSSKDDIDGSQIFDVYYKKNDLDRIKAYCQNDVAALASIYLHMVNQPPLKLDEIKVV